MTDSGASKQLLMIVPFFPPTAGGGVHRPLGFVKNLGKFGWRTTVVAPRPDSFWIQDRSMVDEIPSSCVVHRTDTLSGQFVLSRIRRGKHGTAQSQVRSSRQFSMLRKLGSWVLLPDTYLGWYPFAVRTGRRLIAQHRFDAIYTTSPPETAHLVGLRLHRLSGLPWVADFRDPWMNLYLLPPPTPAHRWLHRRLERKVCARASIVVTSQWHEALVRRRHAGSPRIHLISNGYDHGKFEACAHRAPPQDKFQILHAGMLTQKRTALPFLNALRTFLDSNGEARERCRVIFVGPRESDNARHVDALGLASIVEFRDSIPHAESLKMECSSHILLLLKHADPAYRGIVPGKLYEYLGARRPVLALVPDGEAADTVRRLRRGEVAAPEDEREIAGLIERMYDKYKRGTLDSDYDLSVAGEYTREQTARQLSELLHSLTAERK